MKTHLATTIRVALTILALGAPALASPAQDVFDEVIYYLKTNYGGFSVQNIATLEATHQKELELACQQNKDCPASVAYPILTRLIAALGDEHTAFLAANQNANEAKALFAATAPDGAGTGLIVAPSDANTATVRFVHPGSSADKAGLRRADRIVALNANAIDASNLALLQDGLPKQSIRVVFLRGPTRFAVTLERGPLSPQPGPSLRRLDATSATLVIPSFLRKGLGNEVHALLKTAQSQNITHLVVDVRDNLGGFVAEYMLVAGAFFDLERKFISKSPLQNYTLRYDHGRVLQRRGNLENVIASTATPVRWQGQVALLTNRFSASCSEFLATDFLNATRPVIGEETLGVANTTTSVFGLSDGSVLQVTLNQLVQTSGAPYPATVLPTLRVTDNLLRIGLTGRDAALEQALALLR